MRKHRWVLVGIKEPESAIDTRYFTWRCRRCSIVVMTYGNKRKPRFGIHLVKIKADAAAAGAVMTRKLCDCNEEIISNVMSS